MSTVPSAILIDSPFEIAAIKYLIWPLKRNKER